jgi:hypothetical protein
MNTLQALGLAYRKAKVNLHYSSYALLDAIADYEANLYAKLSDFHAQPQAADETRIVQPKFIGSWTQSGHCAPAKPFKPGPNGFEIEFGRNVLPAGD